MKLGPESQKTKPKIETISSRAANEESDEEDENMRMINEYLRREQVDEDDYMSDEEYFEQDPGPMKDIQERIAKKSIGTKNTTNDSKQSLKSAMKQPNAVLEADLDLPPLVSISANSGKVVDQLPEIKSSVSNRTTTLESKAKKGVSFAEPTKVTEKFVEEEENDKFVVNMVRHSAILVKLLAANSLFVLCRQALSNPHRTARKLLPSACQNSSSKCLNNVQIIKCCLIKASELYQHNQELIKFYLLRLLLKILYNRWYLRDPLSLASV